MKPQLYIDVQKRYHVRREKPQLWAFPECGFGYIQIPKVATRSIRVAFSRAPGLKADSYASFDAFENQTSVHIHHDKIRKRVGELYIFAFVRHPLARLYSAYVNKVIHAEKKGNPCIFHCHGIRFGMSFAEFTERVCAIPDRNIDRHLRAQNWFLCDSKGALIPNFVGHLESFATNWQQLCDRLPALTPVPHENKASNGQDYLAAYTPQTEQLARDRYAKDFSLFGYQ